MEERAWSVDRWKVAQALCPKVPCEFCRNVTRTCMFGAQCIDREEKAACLFDNSTTLKRQWSMTRSNQRSNSRLGSQVRGCGLHCRASGAYRQHHGNVTCACMPSPCNLGLNCLSSYIAKMMVWYDMPCPSISVLFCCSEIA